MKGWQCRTFFVLVCLLVVMAGCRRSVNISEINPVYNPVVEAFTSGKVSRFSPVYLVLNQEIPEEKAGEWQKRLEMTPSVAGEWTQEDRRTLVFRPRQPFDYRTTYRVDADLSAWFDLAEKDRSFSFTFTTYPFDIQAYLQSVEVTAGQANQYDICCNLLTPDKELPAEIESLVVSQPAADMEWEHAPDGKRHTVRLKAVPAGTAGSYTLELLAKENRKGLKSGRLLSVSVPAADDFSVYQVRYVTEPERYVEAVFTQELDEGQTLDGLAYLEGNRSGLVEAEGNKLRLYPDADRTGTVQVVLSRHIRSRSGKELGEHKVWQVEIEKESPAVRFVGEGTVVPGSDELTIPFQAVYLRGVVVRVIKIHEQNMGTFLQMNQLDGAADLMRVGRLVARKTVFLDQPENDLSRWGTYGIDLKKLIEVEPGAIYRIELSFNRDLSAYPCPDIQQKSKEQLLAEDELKFREESHRFDEGGYYYYNQDFDWSDYKYTEREDPCSNSYYADAVVGKNILATNIGLTAKAADRGKMLVWAHDLLTTAPMGQVDVKAYNYQHIELASGQTGTDGKAVLELLDSRPFYLTASCGRQRAYLRVDKGSALSLSAFDVDGELLQQGIKGFIYGERGVWRPGDTLHLDFMLNDRAGNWPKDHPVVMELYNPLGQLYLRQMQGTGTLGLYSFHLPLAPDVPTGAWLAKVSAGGVQFEKRIRIETIKPNRLKISWNWPEDVLRRGVVQRPELRVAWLQGATARNLKYDIQGTFISTPTVFDGYERFCFDDPAKEFRSEESRLITGQTDADGYARAEIGLDIGATAPGMLLANFVTKVYEESGEFSIDALRRLYSPYASYVGIRVPQPGKAKLDTGKDQVYDLITVDCQGKAVPQAELQVQVYKVNWYWWWSSDKKELTRFVSDSYNKPERTFTVRSDANGRASFTLNYPDEAWGTYLIRVTDLQSKHTTGAMSYFDWPGQDGRRDADGSSAASMLVFKTDKPEYRVGETMTVTFPSSAESRALLTIENGAGVISAEEYACQPGETSVRVPVTAAMQPNAYVYITLLQPHGTATTDLPIRMYGVVPFRVTSAESHLKPVVTTPEEWKPESACTVTVSERNGREMAYTLAVVDEGLLDLTRFPTPDPWKAFNAREALGVNTWDFYNYVLGAYGGRLEQLFSIGGDDALNKGPKAIVNRFAPVVLHQGPFLLKPGERRQHEFRMPNYYGKVRVMVIAGDGHAYGQADKSVWVRKPVMLLGTLPRVIGVGEEMVVPATVFATEKGVGNVRVSASCSENMEVAGNPVQTLAFAGKGDKQASFRIRVKDKPGRGRVRLQAEAGGEKATYTAELEIRTVRLPQTQVSVYTLEPGKSIRETYTLPGLAGTNRMTLEVSNIRPVNLSGRLSFLLGYPHGCIEQITSKGFPQLYLSRLMPLSPEQEQVAEEAVKEVISRMRSYQTVDGAFAYWPGGTGAHAWATVYAVHFLLEAKANGYYVPSSLLNQALAYLSRTSRNWVVSSGSSPGYASEEMAQAYRLFVLAMAQKAEVGAMNRLKENRNLADLSRWLLSAAYAGIGRQDVADELALRTVEATAADRQADETFGNENRDRAIRLLACCLLKRSQEAAALADEVSKTLSSSAWLDTHTTAFSLIALSKYVQEHPVDSRMAFVYRFASEQDSVRTVRPVWTESRTFPIETSAAFSVGNQGKAPLFVRVIREGIPAQGEEKASSNGLSLAVSYLDADGRNIPVSKMSQGLNFTSAVTIRNISGKTQRHLVLSQVIPAGWEILNTRYLNGGATDTTASVVTRQDIRDDRVYSYIDRLPAGKQVTVKVNLCAVYPGRYYLPPIACEAMYDNTLRANTEGRTVDVEE